MMVVCLIHVGVLGSLQLVPQIQKELVVDNGVDVLGKLYKGRKLISNQFYFNAQLCCIDIDCLYKEFMFSCLEYELRRRGFQDTKILCLESEISVVIYLHKKEPITVVTLFDDGAYVELVVGLGPVAEEHGPAEYQIQSINFKPLLFDGAKLKWVTFSIYYLLTLQRRST